MKRPNLTVAGTVGATPERYDFFIAAAGSPPIVSAATRGGVIPPSPRALPHRARFSPPPREC
jgi:hypothetical protein